MVRISQAQTPSGSIQGGVPLSRVNANPDDFDDDDDDDDTELMRNSAGNISREQTLAAVMKTESTLSVTFLARNKRQKYRYRK